MVDLFDMQMWPEDRVVHEIERLLLPSERLFECHWSGESNLWVVQIFQKQEDGAKGDLVWSGANFDRRFALFEVFGYLWLETTRPSVGWREPSTRPTKVSVTQHMAEKYSGPEDLDPDEVALVYGRKSKR